MDDMPPGIEVAPGGGPISGGGGFIPPPPGARQEPGGFNAFPGASQAHWAPPPATAPSWPVQAQGSSWGPTGWPRARYGYPSSPYTTTPGASWGELTPASRGLPTPGGAVQELTLGQPITATPYFGGGAGHGEWPPDAGPERRWKPNGRDPGRSPRFVEDMPLERTYSQDPQNPHSPGWDMGFGGAPGYPLMRSLSAGAIERARSRSRGRMVGNVARGYYARDLGPGPEEYDSENLARRPKDWRPDYEARRTFINIPRIQRHRSDVEEYRDPTKRTIRATLDHVPSELRVMYDLRYIPYPETLSFPHLGRPYNHIDFAQLATDPPVDRMRLFHPLLPWYIDVKQQHDNGITVQDVIMQMHLQLQMPISSRHYFNEELGSRNRERIARAFGVRTQSDEEERKKGIKKVDYLEDKVVFVGLVRNRDGLWEMKTIT